MSLRWSPGCGCCGQVFDPSCGQYTLGYSPSSSLSRGEYDSLLQWQPLTDYLQGTRFLHANLNPGIDGNNHITVWEVPNTMQSGPGWTAFEQSRYTEQEAIDWVDRPEEWLPIGLAWDALNEVERRDLVNLGRLLPGMGYVSSNFPVLNPDWYVRFDFSVFEPYTGFPFTLNPAPLVDDDIEVRLIAACEFDVASPTKMPSSGNFLRFVDAGDGSNECSLGDGDVAHIRPEIGTFTEAGGYVVSRSGKQQTWNTLKSTAANSDLAVSEEPEQCDIVGEFDLSSGVTNIIAAAYQSGHIVTTGLTGNWRDRNKAFVVSQGGQYRQGFSGEERTAGSGDLFRVIDIDKLAKGQDGAFEAIPSGVPEDTIHASPYLELESWTDPSFPLGKRVGIYLQSMGTIVDSEFNPEPAWITFRGVTGSRTATVERPTCQQTLTYDCTCHSGFNITADGLPLDDRLLYPTPYEQVFASGAVSQPQVGLEVEELDRGHESWLIDEPLDPPLVNPSNCETISGKSTVIWSWVVNRERYTLPTVTPWVFTRKETVVVVMQNNAVRTQGLLGREMLLEARSGVHTSHITDEPFSTWGYDHPVYATEQEAKDARYIVQEDIENEQDYLDVLNELCKSRSFDNFMSGPIRIEQDRDNDGDIDTIILAGGIAWSDVETVVVDKRAFSCSGTAIVVSFPALNPFGNPQPFAGQQVTLTT